MSEAWQDRVITELEDLERRIKALVAFTESEAGESLSSSRKAMLRSQRYFMQGYAEVLRQRIAEFSEATK